jgi:predicted nucleotidyltransferase
LPAGNDSVTAPDGSSGSRLRLVSATIGSRDREQLAGAIAVVRAVLADDLLGAYLYGSAVAGGLRHRSDLDLLVVSARPTTLDEKARLIAGLASLSGSPAAAGPARSLEVSIVEQAAVRPWRYPPPLDFQYGDWFRGDYERGDVTPWESPNPDVAVLLTTALEANEPLAGPPLADLVDPVPRDDLDRAMTDGIPGLLADLADDTANVLLTLARIWNTLATGEISPKDVAARWALGRLPAERRAGLERARAVYLGDEADEWEDLRTAAEADARHLVEAINAAAGAG